MKRQVKRFTSVSEAFQERIKRIKQKKSNKGEKMAVHSFSKRNSTQE